MSQTNDGVVDVRQENVTSKLIVNIDFRKIFLAGYKMWCKFTLLFFDVVTPALDF